MALKESAEVRWSSTYLRRKERGQKPAAETTYGSA